MKLSFSILFLFCLFTGFYAQEHKDNSSVIGLGFFKINKFTTQQMDSLLKAQQYKVVKQDLSTNLTYKSTDPKIAIKIQPSRRDSVQQPGMTINGYQSYTINTLTLTDKETNEEYTNKDIRFNFYKNKLFSINIHRPDHNLISRIDSTYTFKKQKLTISIPYKNCTDGKWEQLNEEVEESILENEALILRLRPRLETTEPCYPYLDREKKEIIISDKRTTALVKEHMHEEIQKKLSDRYNK